MNGKHIGSGNDAFVRWKFPLKAGVLAEGNNTMVVSFTAPKAAATASAAEYPYPVPASV